MAVELNELTQTSGEWLRGNGPEADIVISSRIRLARNLAEFPFISRATPQDRVQIERILRDAHHQRPTPPATCSISPSMNWKASIASCSSSGTSSAASTPRAKAAGPWPSTRPRSSAS